MVDDKYDESGLWGNEDEEVTPQVTPSTTAFTGPENTLYNVDNKEEDLFSTDNYKMDEDGFVEEDIYDEYNIVNTTTSEDPYTVNSLIAQEAEELSNYDIGKGSDPLGESFGEKVDDFFESTPLGWTYGNLVNNPTAEGYQTQEYKNVQRQMMLDHKNGLIELPGEKVVGESDDGPLYDYDWESAHDMYPQYETKADIRIRKIDEAKDIRERLDELDSVGAFLGGGASYIADPKIMEV